MATVRRTEKGIFHYDEVGRFHSATGPAKQWHDGRQEWFYHGQRHRGDGPAVVHPNGDEEWWLFDQRVDMPKILQNQMPALSIEQRLMAKIWSEFESVRSPIGSIQDPVIGAITDFSQDGRAGDQPMRERSESE